MRVHGDNRQYANGFCCYRAFKLKSFDLKNALTSRNFDISLTSNPGQAGDAGMCAADKLLPDI